jgi:hypothetical protein
MLGRLGEGTFGVDALNPCRLLLVNHAGDYAGEELRVVL